MKRMRVGNQETAINNKVRAIEQTFVLDPVNKSSLLKLIVNQVNFPITVIIT